MLKYPSLLFSIDSSFLWKTCNELGSVIFLQLICFRVDIYYKISPFAFFFNCTCILDPVLFNTYPKIPFLFCLDWIFGSIPSIDMFLLWWLLLCSVCENLFNQRVYCFNDNYFRLLLNMTILMSTWRLWMLLLISFLKIKWYVDSDALWYFVYYVYACAHIWKKENNNDLQLECLCKQHCLLGTFV